MLGCNHETTPTLLITDKMCKMLKETNKSGNNPENLSLERCNQTLFFVQARGYIFIF